MMMKRSPPKHRHDGTSPLPLGMDWSPPPKKWEGRDTIWPHDCHTGWSYCVTVSSWTALPANAFDKSSANPVVFYRVQVGLQSPDGVTSTRAVLRRFSDFLKLFTTLKRIFLRKHIPPPPPRHAFLWVNSNRMQLEERRSALDEWIGKLLSDIDLSRSVPVATFLELEVAARSFFAGSSSDASQNPPLTPDYASDNTYEASDIGTPIQTPHGSEMGAEDILSEQDLSFPGTVVGFGRSNHENGLPSERIRDKLKMNSRGNGDFIEGSNVILDGQGDASSSGDKIEFSIETGDEKLTGHSRRLSSESVGSDLSTIRASEHLNAVGSSLGRSSPDMSVEGPSISDFQFIGELQILLPLDQRQKLNRVLVTMQRRLTTTRTDMEDLIARVNQEVAVKEYLTTKVKDLEVELETTRHKSKENLQQTILIERERITQLQWDMEEMRRKHLEMDTQLKHAQDERNQAEVARKTATAEKEYLKQELDVTKEHLENLQKVHEEQEAKAKADVKVLVKEVKSLRKFQAESKEELQQALKEKAEQKRLLDKERQKREIARASRTKLLHECEILRCRLQECTVNFLADDEQKFTVDSSSLSDALGLLATSDNRIGLLLAEAQLLAQEEDGTTVSPNNDRGRNSNSSLHVNSKDAVTDDETSVRKMLTDVLVENARLQKQVNSVYRCALQSLHPPEKEGSEETETPSSIKTVLNKFL